MSKLLFFFKDFIYFWRGGGREKEGEKRQCVVASCMLPTGDLAHNTGMCFDRESNRRLLGSQAGTQSTEPHQPGLGGVFVFCFVLFCFKRTYFSQIISRRWLMNDFMVRKMKYRWAIDKNLKFEGIQHIGQSPPSGLTLMFPPLQVWFHGRVTCTAAQGPTLAKALSLA